MCMNSYGVGGCANVGITQTGCNNARISQTGCSGSGIYGIGSTSGCGCSGGASANWSGRSCAYYRQGYADGYAAGYSSASSCCGRVF